MKRLLSATFLTDLKSGKLKEILDFIQHDHTLDIEIRENYINIYYRGGNILKVIEKGKGRYDFNFDKKYLNISPHITSSILSGYKTSQDWYNYFPLMKQAMDFYFSKNKKEEREYQQLVVRENNYSTLANGTDYFIIDIEYDNHEKARFDLIAVEWPSKGSDRKLAKNFKPKLVVIEMKYGDKAISGSAGMKKHWNDFVAFTSNTIKLSAFKTEMLELFRQKRELGLIPCLSSSKNSNDIKGFAKDVELAFLNANHDPASSKLKTEILSCGSIPVKFISSTYMGYGIYNEGIYSLNNFKVRFKDHF